MILHTLCIFGAFQFFFLKEWSNIESSATIRLDMTTEPLSLSEILSRLMFKRRIRTTELARQVNIPQPTLSRILSGLTTNPHLSSLQMLASFFEVSVEQLKGDVPIPLLNSLSPETADWTRIPLLTWEQATEWPANKNIEQACAQIYTDARIGINAFALSMKDASMEPQFPKGTFLVIDPDKEAKDRSFVIATIKNYPKAIFRQLLIDGPHRYLKPVSPDFDNFKMILLGGEDLISGILVQARRNYEE